MHHLGTFEGERFVRSRGYREPCSAGRAVASLISMAFFVGGVALVLGVI